MFGRKGPESKAVPPAGELTPDEKAEATGELGDKAVEAAQQLLEADFELPAGWQEPKDEARGAEDHGSFTVVDRRGDDGRGSTLVIKEESEQDYQERLKAPLEPAEWDSALGALTRQGLAINEQIGAQKGDRPPFTTADSLGLYRLAQMLHGERFFFSSTDDVNQPIGQRLDALEKDYHSRRLVDPESRQILTVGYDSEIYYQIARAKQVYDTLQNDPADVRKEVLRGTVTDATCDAFIKPLTVAESEEITDDQAYDPAKRYIGIGPTPPSAYFDWVQKSRRPPADELREAA